jgi:mannose-6-phosphate isomerase
VHTIAVAGHICVDVTPELGPTAQLTPGRLIEVGPLALELGGCVANTARALGALGVPVLASALTGDDELGRYAQRAVAELPGVTGRLTACPGRATSYSLVLEPPRTDRTFWHHTGVNCDFTGASVDLDGADLLHVGYPSLLPGLLTDGGTPLVELLGRARAAGLTTSIDLAVVDPDSAAGRLDWAAILARVLPLVDIVSPSADDLVSALRLTEPVTPALVETLADRLIGWGAAVVAVSAGAGGVRLRAGSADRLAAAGRVLAPLAGRWAGAARWQAPIAVETVATTNGAGDACTAGLLAAIARGADPRSAALVAVGAAAAAVAGRRPTPDEVLARVPAAGAVLGDEGPARPPAGPIVLPANQPRDRFYRGGSRIAAFRGDAAPPPNTPEDWVGSTTCVRGQDPTGRTVLPDGADLATAIAADPEYWLGAAHLARYGVDTKLLVKLLDAGQRLPVHAHPDGAFARAELGAAHGKAEAWSILAGGEVHLGLRRTVEPAELRALVDGQDTETLIELLHRVPVAPGDRVYVPPGVLHAIGEGVLLAEVQEPEDLSILLEWRDFDLDGTVDGHLGLGFDKALQAVERTGRTPAEVDALIVRSDDRAAGLPAAADEYFRLERIDVAGRAVLGDGFVVLIVVDGPLALEGPAGGVALPAGATVLLPAGCPSRQLHGQGRALIARPPAA